MDITFGAPLLKTIMRKDTAIAVLSDIVYVYSIPDGRLLLEAPTRQNRNGVIDFKQNRLAVPGHKQGSVHVSIFEVYFCSNFFVLSFAVKKYCAVQER